MGNGFLILAEVSREPGEGEGALAKIRKPFDSGVDFRGERGPRLEQIAAIRAKEIYEGSLAAAHARAEHELVRDLSQAGPGPEGPRSGSAISPRPGGGEDSHGTPRGGAWETSPGGLPTLDL
jgi:hypothetical protein